MVPAQIATLMPEDRVMGRCVPKTTAQGDKNYLRMEHARLVLILLKSQEMEGNAKLKHVLTGSS